MKYTLIATIVVLALAQGALSAESPELEKMTKMVEGMTAELLATVQKLSETLQSQPIIEEGKAQIEPIVTQIRENLAPLAASVQEKVTPLATNVQEQIQPLVDNIQNKLGVMLRELMDQAQAIGQ